MSDDKQTPQGFASNGILYGITRRALSVLEWAYNLSLSDPRVPEPVSELPEITEIRDHALPRTDISDHLLPLFLEAMAVHPQLIVELGVRTGESTFSLERVATLCGSTLVSVDIDDCARVSTCKNRTFVKSDDIAFARKFPDWCAERGIRPEIDVLFIDTSHLYDHTVQEIKSWFPFLSQNSKVFFHDTNQRRVYYRQDKSMGIGWNSDRGVIRALQEYLGVTFDENVSFTNTWKGWIVRHNALCSGFTILERLNLTSPNTSRGRSNRSSSRDNDFNTVDMVQECAESRP
jgi:cephalosporin hydroxylase